MKSFQSIIPALGLVAVAQAWGSDWNSTWVTTTVTTDIFTTVCPSATTFVQNTKTYTATVGETIVVTDCPCTYVTSKPALPTPTPSESPLPHTYVSPPTGNATFVPPPVWFTTTEIVETYTTYCPSPTTVVQGNHTYTVTSAETLTVTNCPCTHVTSASATAYTTTTSYLTTYCPNSTVVTYGSTTFPITKPGTTVIPIVSVSPINPIAPVSSPVVSPPVVAPTSVAATKTPTAPSATSSGPVQVSANAAVQNGAGLGVFAAGLAALLL